MNRLKKEKPSHKKILSWGGMATVLFSSYVVQSAELAINQSPLFLSTGEKPNVLVVMDNSNSMDESANGAAAGSANPNSKSEIARSAVQNLITAYTGKINMGLMAYQQGAIVPRNLSNSPYDMSFNPADYDPSFDLSTPGSRASATKKYRMEKADDLGSYVYYNVALPFYYTGAPEISGYCYAYQGGWVPPATWGGCPTFTGEVGLTGIPVCYVCSDHKTGTSNVVPGTGYSGNVHYGKFSPTDSDFAQGISSFGSRQAGFYVSPTWFSNSSPGRGFLHTFIKELDASHASTLNTKLGTSQFVTNAPTDPAYPLQNAGLTPLEGTLQTARNYFAGNALPADEGGPADTLPESCGKDFIALLTDGLPSVSAGGVEVEVADVDQALIDVATATGNLNSDGVETYMIGFALPAGTNPGSLDAIAAGGGTGTAYLANDSATLQATFDTIFNDILAKSGASSSAATNTTSLSTNSFVYQAHFSSEDWHGELRAKTISNIGFINPLAQWEANTQLNLKAPGGRVILTFSQDTQDGIPFRWANINAETSSASKDILNTNPLTHIVDGLGADRVDFLRGGSGGTSSGAFRTNRVNKLGDIVHSTPYYVGAPAAGYNDLEMSGYSAFRSSKASRTPVLYTGANDGMLHGFNASTGEELLAYIPGEVFPNITKLTAAGYGTNALGHHYFVDGAPIVADADVGGWKTVLVGGLNAGGQGVYALDVTNPASFTEGNAGTIVLWEFNDEDDVDLGYTFIQPTFSQLTHQSGQIVKMANGRWAVIFGNGYNNTEADGYASTTGHAYLYILFIGGGTDGTWTQGTDYIKIDTGVGDTTTPNGMATPNPIDTDGDGDIDIIYAGDLQGNLWKFDVSDASPASWTNAVTGGNNSLYTAMDSGSTPQPITSAPLVTSHPEGGYMIGFGTGKYMEITDITTTDTQAFYGLWDDDTTNTHIVGTLIEQEVLGTTTIGGHEYRYSTKKEVDYASKKGWYINLPTSAERIDVNPIIRDGRFVFVTRIPASGICSAGGSSWLMELDYLTGAPLEISPFDVNGNNKINKDDSITVTIDSTDEDTTVTGVHSGGGMFATPTVQETDNPREEYKVLVDSDGQIKSVLESAKPAYKGRVSWEEVR